MAEQEGASSNGASNTGSGARESGADTRRRVDAIAHQWSKTVAVARKFADGLTENERDSARGERVHQDLLAENANWDRYRPQVPVDANPKLGICCSGGGLRSAAFNLGALQVMRESGHLAEADHLAAVSGGNYMAAAHVITAGLSDDELLEDQAPWGPGSPEERRLRNHSTYLASGLKGRVWLIVNLLYGMVLNFLPFFLGSVVLGKLLGWTFGAFLQPDLESGQRVGSVEIPAWVPWSLLALAVGGFVMVMYRRFIDRTSRITKNDKAEEVERVGVIAMLTSVALGFLLVGVPFLVLAFRTITVRGEAFVEQGEVGVAPTETVPGQGDPLVVSVNTLAALAVITIVTVLLARAGRVRHLVRLGAAIVGPGLLLVPFLAVTSNAAAFGPTFPRDLWLVGGCLFGMLVHGLFLHNTRYSMHLFYKERLSTVFAVVRELEDGRIEANQADYSEAIRLSSTAAMVPSDGTSSLPELIVCAAVNISDDTVPPGRRSGSFTFTAEESGGALTGYLPTTELERPRGVRATTLTLPALMAISGAAVSPQMGRSTIAPLRFLMALANVRLGVWLPNPRRLDEFDAQEAHRLRISGGESIDHAPRHRRWWWHLVDGWREPGAAYVLREALGMTSISSRYVYVSDGGHWENLGLVELLRRGCTDIVCFDASGDDINQLSVLGTAIGLARSELGVTVTIDPSDLHTDPATGLSTSSIVTGTFAYPGRDHVTGRLWYAKASMTAQAPWDLQAYKRRNTRFPNHSTGDQFFDDERFESYRALGRHIGSQLAAEFPLDRPQPTSSDADDSDTGAADDADADAAGTAAADDRGDGIVGIEAESEVAADVQEPAHH